jgi:hypothetical protein
MSVQESQSERLDRELMELLNELRVFLPGVQVLLAFLLTAPFNQRFQQLAPTLKEVYFAAVLCATASVVLLMAPGVHHRLRWREGDKERLLRWGNQFALLGAGFLAAAVVLAVWVVTRVLYSPTTALVTAAIAVVAFAALWLAVPLLRPGPDAD